MAAVVIADASPLIALARVDGLGWLPTLFGEVLVSDVVLAEVLPGRFPQKEGLLAQAIQAGWLRLATAMPSEPWLPDLDEGEAASIRLALASGPNMLLLIDGRAGRAVARELGLKLAGIAAVIGLARQQGLIPSARAVFAALHASDFRITPEVIQAVLERCGE